MKQLSVSKKRALFSALRAYRKKFLTRKDTDLDESATRLMINAFLTEVLGFESLDEIKTEYMIRHTYADYVVQLKKKRYFIVEVKALQYELSEKHLRQVVNYAANEGIEWALLTNGRDFQFYKILFTKPIHSRLVFSLNLSLEKQLIHAVDKLQFLTRDLISDRALGAFWNQIDALDPSNICKLLLSKQVISHLQRQLKRKFKDQFSEGDIANSLRQIIWDKVQDVENLKIKGRRRRRKEKQFLPASPEMANGGSAST